MRIKASVAECRFILSDKNWRPFSRGRMHRIGLLLAAPSAAVDFRGQSGRVESTVAWGEVDKCRARPDNGLGERVEEKRNQRGVLLSG